MSRSQKRVRNHAAKMLFNNKPGQEVLVDTRPKVVDNKKRNAYSRKPKHKKPLSADGGF